MFIVLHYEINEKRYQKISQICQEYLMAGENSTFEGEITDADFDKMAYELQEVTKDQDSIIVYPFRQMEFEKALTVLIMRGILNSCKIGCLKYSLLPRSRE